MGQHPSILVVGGPSTAYYARLRVHRVPCDLVGILSVRDYARPDIMVYWPDASVFEPPKTQQELLDAAKKLTKADGSQYGIALLGAKGEPTALGLAFATAVGDTAALYPGRYLAGPLVSAQAASSGLDLTFHGTTLLVSTQAGAPRTSLRELDSVEGVERICGQACDLRHRV